MQPLAAASQVTPQGTQCVTPSLLLLWSGVGRWSCYSSLPEEYQCRASQGIPLPSSLWKPAGEWTENLPLIVWTDCWTAAVRCRCVASGARLFFQPVSTNLYLFCFRRPAISLLPAWTLLIIPASCIHFHVFWCNTLWISVLFPSKRR